ncbi:hypothetical protein [Sphingomonas flavescens]|uniref:hypothetical protein n=1 Tax=Sphingomonas flavescens TaxID=3132797 RepID=UPI00280595F3|nr:hypothetical protein [Sphingomonas limnosediminicola]
MSRPGSRRPPYLQLAAPNRDEVSKDHWQELLRLLDEGEISAEIAKQIERDLFESRAAGEPPKLRDDAWERHLEGRHARIERALFGATSLRPKPL